MCVTCWGEVCHCCYSMSSLSESNFCFSKWQPLKPDPATGRASTVQNTIEVMGRCAILTTAATVLSELKIQLQPDTNLLETPVTENRAIGHLAPLSFYYMHLHQQCDSLLLMGGVGVEHCSRPSDRNPNYHPWDKRKVLPKASFMAANWQWVAGRSALSLSEPKWKYLVRLCTVWTATGSTRRRLPELGKFTCEPCVVVAGSGYSQAHQAQRAGALFLQQNGHAGLYGAGVSSGDLCCGAQVLAWRRIRPLPAAWCCKTNRRRGSGCSE